MLSEVVYFSSETGDCRRRCHVAIAQNANNSGGAVSLGTGAHSKKGSQFTNYKCRVAFSPGVSGNQSTKSPLQY